MKIIRFVKMFSITIIIVLLMGLFPDGWWNHWEFFTISISIFVYAEMYALIVEYDFKNGTNYHKHL